MTFPARRAQGDILAGLTTSTVVIPKSLAYASLAGLPLQAGLCVACFPMLAYALFGASPVLSVSSTTTIAILTAGQVATFVPDGNVERVLAVISTLAVLTGVFLLLARLLRLGFLAEFISDPVLTGFKAGIGVVIVVDQLPKLLGLHVEKAPFVASLVQIFERVSDAHLPTIGLSAGVIAVLYLLERFAPRAPAPLIAIAASAVVVGLLGASEHGFALSAGVSAGFPAPILPDLALAQVLWPGALGIALMSFTESVAAERAFAPAGTVRVPPDRELLALGAANVVSGLLRGFPAGGGTSQTAVNARAGAASRTAGLVTAVVAGAAMLLLAPWIRTLPQAALAGIVVVTSLPLIAPRDFRKILGVHRTEFLWAIAALAGVVFLGTLEGILVAVGISILSLMHQANHPSVYAVGRRASGEGFQRVEAGESARGLPPGLLVLRTEGRVTFANAARVGESMRALVLGARPRVVVLECSAIPDFEYTALSALSKAQRRLRAEGVELWLAALNHDAEDTIRRSELKQALGVNGIFASLNEAVRAYEARARAHP